MTLEQWVQLTNLIDGAESQGDCLIAAVPSVMVGKRRIKPPRYIYEAYYGPLRGRGKLYHTCKNPSCINIAHLKSYPVERQAHTVIATLTTEELNKLDVRWARDGFTNRREYLRHLILKELADEQR